MKETDMIRFLEKEKSIYGIVAKNLSLSRGGKPLINEANFTIYPGKKVALIGRNGGGKTTLLETILAISKGDKLPDGVTIEGKIDVFPQTRIGYFPQEIRLNFQGTVGEYLDLCATEVATTYNQWINLTKELESNYSNQVLQEYEDVIEKMNILNGWNYLEKKEMILGSLGLNSNFLEKKIGEISGGQANRVALAGVLISSPNLFLLDEPTNNLDFEALEFLKEFIQKGEFSLLLISHDRQFLDETIDEILEIDEESLTVSHFGGNYSFYVAEKKRLFENQIAAYEEQKRRREELEKTAKALKQKAAEFEGTSRNAFYRARGARLAKQAKMQLERIQEELSSIPEPKPPKKPAFVVEENEKRGLLIKVSDISFAYPGQKNLFSNLSFSLNGNERVAIIGPNGVGKTTLIRLILKEIKPKEGEITITKNVGYLPQTPSEVNKNENVIDYFRRQVAVSEEDTKKILGRVLFSDVSWKKIGDFSSGEIRRIQIAILFAKNPDLIILDEPTNHLDVYTIEMLEEALKRFKGGILVASHDEWFLRNIGINRFLIFERNGNILDTKTTLKKFL